MNEPEDKPTEPLEGILRRWGADQAAREALVPPAPVSKRPKRSRLSVIVYWVSTAAAAGVLVAVGLVYFAPTWLGLGTAERAERAAPPYASSSAKDLQRQLARARGALNSASTSLEEAQDKLTAAVSRAENAEAEVAFLRRTQQQQKKSTDQMRGRVTEAEKTRKQAEDDLSITLAQLKAARTTLALATAERDKLRDDLKSWPTRLAEATAELKRMRKMHDDAIAGSKTAETRLQAVKAARRTMLSDLQRAFLGLEPGAADTLAARQAAAKRAKITRRLILLRPAVHREPTRRLLDKLEVAFTRLAMLDTTDSSAVKSFQELVVAGGLLDQIDDVLAAGTEPPKTRMWLLEVGLILLGVDRVG